MFGKRSTSEALAPAPAPRPAAPAPDVAAAPAENKPSDTGRGAPFPSEGLGAPLVSAPTPSRHAGGAGQHAGDRFAPLGSLLRDQEHHLRRADRSHRSGAAGAARRRLRARGNPRHRQRDHRDQEHRDVDLRAGGTARRHLQRRARLSVRSSRCSRATTSPTSWSTAPARSTSKSLGKIQKTGIRFRDNQQLLNICQRIVSQIGRRVDESSPICDARLPDGSRVNCHRAAAGDRRAGAHHPQVQEGQADARPAGQVRHRSRRRAREILRIIGRCRVQHAGLRRHRFRQDHAAQLSDPLHRRRRTHHHLRRRRRIAAAAAARGAPGNPPAQPRRRRPGHHARSGPELPAHAP